LSANRNTERENDAPQDVLSSSVHVKGTMKVRRPLLIDGVFEGEIKSEGVITIGVHGKIHGDIDCKTAIVLGSVFGNITAERCELRAQALIQGDIRVARIVIEEGASFIGRTQMVTPERATAAPVQVRDQPRSAALSRPAGA
jgi:cytoskeletal protein CcmA (bactofilin family)